MADSMIIKLNTNIYTKGGISHFGIITQIGFTIAIIKFKYNSKIGCMIINNKPAGVGGISWKIPPTWELLFVFVGCEVVECGIVS